MYFNDQVGQIGISVNRVAGHSASERIFCAIRIAALLGKLLPRIDHLVEVLDFHVGAKLIREGDITAHGGIIIHNDRGRSRGDRILNDCLEDFVQFFTVLRGQIVFGILGTLATVRVRRGIGEVAGHGMHERIALLRVGRIVVRSIRIRRIGTRKDTHRIDRGTAILQGLGSCHGVICDPRVKTIVMVRLAIGKENDNGFGILAFANKSPCLARDKPTGMLQAVIRAGCTGGLQIIDGIFQILRIRREVFNNLTAVIRVITILIRRISYFIAVVTSIFYQSNAVLQTFVRNACV